MLRLTAAVLLGLGLTGAAAFADPPTPTAAGAPMTFQADEVEYEEEHSLTIAKGHVEIAQGTQVLLADVVTYNQRTDTVTASGHVSLMTDDGQVVFADYMELRDSMNNAFAHDVRVLLNDRSRLVANAARRTNGNHLDLRKVVYSPCDLCASDPSKPPAWQLKASQVTDDKDLQKLEFRDAIMEIEGWPVFYTPYIVTPDPSVKRASGFLTPSIGNSTSLGFHVGIPYYQTLGPSADMTIYPRFTTSAGQDLAAEYRQRFSNGEFNGIASIDYSNVGFAADPTIKHDWRWHVSQAGIWDIDDTYRAGFSLQRVSDQTYLQRFGFPVPGMGTEVSRVYLEGFPDNGSLDVNAYAFEPLTPSLGDSTQPIVLPVINRDWQFKPDSVGGTLRFNANLLDITREVGTQTRRLSGTAGWDRMFRDGLGGEYKFQVNVRGDAYSIQGLSNLSNPDLPSAYFSQNGQPPIQHVPSDFFAARLFPQMGLTWDYPVVHHGDPFDLMIQPTVATFIGPNGGNTHRIPDEDSLGYQFRDTDLFRADRLQGYDLLDTGQRVDYGLHLGAYDKTGGSYRVLIGQSYRAEPNPFVPPGSGMDQRLSDIVGRVVLAPNSYLDMIYRFRLDKESLADRGQELSLGVGPANLKLGASYLLIPAEQPSQLITVPGSGATILYGKREQLNLSLAAKVTRYWSLAASETVNLTNATNIVNGVATPQANNANLQTSVSAIYQDECMAFIATASQSAIRNGDVTPGYQVMFSVVFKNIGQFGGNVLSVSPGQ
ncbi:MAG TPA: LPS assembly protein LptD [Stellaceae bacterium]|nr:LPS assembly protein LptD [Stellaceae bacterium]